jgi:hypothetical protein
MSICELPSRLCSFVTATRGCLWLLSQNIHSYALKTHTVNCIHNLRTRRDMLSNKLHGAEPFLRSCQLYSHSRNRMLVTVFTTAIYWSLSHITPSSLSLSLSLSQRSIFNYTYQTPHPFSLSNILLPNNRTNSNALYDIS